MEKGVLGQALHVGRSAVKQPSLRVKRGIFLDLYTLVAIAVVAF